MSKLEMLTPQNHAIALIDFQPAMYQSIQPYDRLVTFINVQVLAKAAKLFNVPIIITTVAQNTFSGPFMPEITALFPEQTVIDRTSMNSWLDGKFGEHASEGGRGPHCARAHR
jgi:nicotinamidase-related amidase